MADPERTLLERFRALTPQAREQLLDYAEFLASKSENVEPEPELNPIPRPDEETVVAALKRLSATYPMLERKQLLNETSAYMAQHMLEGRDAKAVIDDLEALFARRYRQYRGEDGA